MLCINLQLNRLGDGFIEPNKDYRGVLRLTPSDNSKEDLCDGDLTFKEIVMAGSVCCFDGKHITATQRADGTPRLNFRALKLDGDFNIDRFALEVANEIRQALKYFLMSKISWCHNVILSIAGL